MAYGHRAKKIPNGLSPRSFEPTTKCPMNAMGQGCQKYFFNTTRYII